MSSRTTTLLLLFILGGLYQNRIQIKHWLNPPPPRTAGAESVVLYATEWCGYCAKTRKFFKENGIAYQEKDIEKSEQSHEEYEKLGGHGVPVVVVDQKTVIHGYSPDELSEALGL